MALQQPRWRFTVADYHRMAEAGILHEDDRVELIEGEIVQMSPIGSKHAGNVDRLAHFFLPRLQGRAIVRVQNPIQMGDYSEPEPDLVLLRPRDDFYTSAHPTPADVLLVIEVAETSAAYDRQDKAALYARGGIPEYWVADLGQASLIVYCDPTPDGYTTVRVLRRGEAIRPLAFPDLEVAVTDLLG